MKFYLSCLVLFLPFAQSLLAQQSLPVKRLQKAKDSLGFYDRQLTPAAMHSDLAIFRDIRNKANSGLYAYRSKQQIDSIYSLAFKKISRPMSNSAFYKIILELTDFEGSCHNYTELDQKQLDYLRRVKKYFPYALKYIEGKIVFNNESPLPTGSRIVSINGQTDTALMNSFYKYMPADGFTTTEKKSGSVDKSFGLRYLLEYGLSDSFIIRFSPPYSNAVKSITVPAVSLEQREKNIAARHSAAVEHLIDYRLQPTHSFRMLNDSAALLNFRIFSMASGRDDPAFAVYVRFIDSVFTELSKHKTRHLIMDIRGNPGGSDPLFEQPMMYLSDKPFKENVGAWSIFDTIPYEKYFWGITTSHKMKGNELVEGKQFLRSYFTKPADGKNHQNPLLNPVYSPKSPAFEGQLYLLIDENVASAGSHLASLVKAYARKVIIVGVETCGGYYLHNGHIPNVYQLPHSKIKTKFSIVHVVQDAPVKADQPVGRGIIPDHEVWTSFDDFMKNRDTQMEYVKHLITRQ